MVLVFNSYDRITILFSLLIRIHHFQKIIKKLKLKYVYICVCVCDKDHRQVIKSCSYILFFCDTMFLLLMCFKALFYVFSDRPRSSRQHSYNHNFRRPGDPSGKTLHCYNKGNVEIPLNHSPLSIVQYLLI
jgi:hypothetical protein